MTVSLFFFECSSSDKETIDYSGFKSSVLEAASEGNESLAEYLKTFSSQPKDSLKNIDTAAFILASMEPEIAMERLGFLVNHSDPFLRMLAAESLGIRGGAESVALLKKLINDGDEGVRKAAFESIAQSGISEGEVLLRKELNNPDNHQIALRAAANSKYRTIWIPLLSAMVRDWDKDYCSPDFIERLMVIRRLIDSNVNYHLKKRNAAMETPREIRLIGIAGDEWALKMLMDKASQATQKGSRDPNLKPMLEALSIVPNERAIVHLLVIRKNVEQNGDLHLVPGVDAAVKNAFFFNKYMIQNGDDDFKLIGLKSLVVFAGTGYRDDIGKILTELKSTKPGNPLIVDMIKNCFLLIEQ